MHRAQAEEPDKNGIAKLVAERRGALDMTTKDLSEESGIPEKTIRTIEAGQHVVTEEEWSLLKLALDISGG